MKTFMLAVAALAALGAGASALAQPADPARQREPAKIVNRADAPQAAKRPTGQQRIAVVRITLEVDKGAVRTARVASVKQMAAYAPKVFARRGGPWEVIIEGDTRRSFFVDNPALREAEAHRSSNNQYQWVGETGVIEWPLVVPLYADGRPLNARSITIRDTVSGATILQAQL